ncbi:MAG: putative nitroreductase [Dehalococcoidia bacterium]|nr:putative nitroreductase [Dehalococcoidia bacterium]
MKEAFSEGNQVVAQAPVLIFICADPQQAMVRDGVNYYLFDAGLATENMLLAATDLDLATHAMTGFKEPDVKRILGIPDGIKVVAATPLACTSQPSYEEAARERLAARKRKSMQELVFWNSWGVAR